jgi:hypothetical protein
MLMALSYPARLTAHLTAPEAPRRCARVTVVSTRDAGEGE